MENDENITNKKNKVSKIKYFVIVIIAIILLTIEAIVLYNITNNKDILVASPNQSIKFKEFLIYKDMPEQSNYSIKYIIKDSNKEENNQYCIYYVYQAKLLKQNTNENDRLNEDFFIKFEQEKIDLSKIVKNTMITSSIIILISVLYILIGKYEKINEKIKSIIYILLSTISFLIIFILVPMISGNYGDRLYLYIMLATIFILNFMWGYKKKSIFRFSLLEVIPFYLGTLFNYSNTYLGNARIDNLSNIFAISNISDTISFITTLFAYIFVGIISGTLGRFYKEGKLEDKFNKWILRIFALCALILLAVKIFVPNTLSIIASNAINKMLPATIIVIILVLIKIVYNKIRDSKNDINNK